MNCEGMDKQMNKQSYVQTDGQINRWTIQQTGAERTGQLVTIIKII